MAILPFEASVRHTADSAIVDMRGEIDGFAEDALNSAYTEAATDAAQAVLLNFSEVNYINSTGIALIVRLLAEARRDGREIVVAGLSSHYREIFRITRLSDYMTIEEDVPVAGASAAVGSREGA